MKFLLGAVSATALLALPLAAAADPRDGRVDGVRDGGHYGYVYDGRDGYYDAQGGSYGARYQADGRRVVVERPRVYRREDGFRYRSGAQVYVGGGYYPYTDYGYGYGYGDDGYDVGVQPSYPAYEPPVPAYGDGYAYDDGRGDGYAGPPQAPAYEPPQYCPQPQQACPPPQEPPQTYEYRQPPCPPEGDGCPPPARPRRHEWSRWIDWSAGAPPADCGRWVWHEEVRKYHWEPAPCRAEPPPPCPPDRDRDEIQ